jgi:hypothetical protein
MAMNLLPRNVRWSGPIACLARVAGVASSTEVNDAVTSLLVA